MALIINREGRIVSVIAGTDKEILIPQLSDYELGRKSLKGIRLIHTHLKNEPLSKDDITDLLLLRLDAIVAIGVSDKGEPLQFYKATLLPKSPTKETYIESAGQNFQKFERENNFDFYDTITELEAEMGRRSLRKTGDRRERAMLVSIATKDRPNIESSIEELAALAETCNVTIIDKILQKPKKLNPKYLIGTGKLKDLIIDAMNKEASLIIFDNDLTPTQIREITEVTELKVMDRTQLILDIFATRALSKDGKLQVELAQLKHLLPKLTGKGTAMSRLMGGIGGRGPGETKLENDRRKIQKRISHLSDELKKISKSRKERRSLRNKKNIPVISIIGYTNAGKSTLLNTITQSKVLVEDKLFATLDTSAKRLRMPREREVIIVDTVGFIENLPKELTKAFRATIEEIDDSDLLINLIDIANPEMPKHIKVVTEILEQMEDSDIPIINVFNKIDLIDERDTASIVRKYNGIGINAKDKKSLNPLMMQIEKVIFEKTEEKDEEKK